MEFMLKAKQRLEKTSRLDADVLREKLNCHKTIEAQVFPFSIVRPYERISPGPRLMYPFLNKATIYDEELSAPSPIPKLEDYPLVCCPRLLIQYLQLLSKLEAGAN